MLGKLNVLLMVIRESGLLVATGSCWTSMMIFLSSLVHSLISQCLCEQTNLPRAFLVHVRSLSSSNAIGSPQTRLPRRDALCWDTVLAVALLPQAVPPAYFIQ